MNMEVWPILHHLILQGLIYSLVVLGVYLSSRVLKFDDLTTEGSFGYGGAITAVMISAGLNQWLTAPLAMLGGLCAGLVTGLLHTKLNMNNLISGLVVTTGLFSICLALAGSNRSLAIEAPELLTLILIVAVIYGLLSKLFASEIGLLLKALGNNPQLLTSLGKSVDGYKIAGLALANSLTALAGCLFVQASGFFSITGNVGTLVIGLAGLILGEVFSSRLIGLILGAILYQAIFALTIELELEPMWNNLIKASLIVGLIQLRRGRLCCN